jgi:hypothetical protein
MRIEYLGGVVQSEDLEVPPESLDDGVGGCGVGLAAFGLGHGDSLVLSRSGDSVVRVEVTEIAVAGRLIETSIRADGLRSRRVT